MPPQTDPEPHDQHNEPLSPPHVIPPASPFGASDVSPSPTTDNLTPVPINSPQLSPSEPLPASTESSRPVSSSQLASAVSGRKKMLLPLIIGLVVLFGGSAVAYVGYYLPNKPSNIWRTALVATGMGYDKLSQYATTNKYAKGVNLEGSFKLSGPFAIDGTLSGQSNGQNSEFISTVSAVGVKVSTDLRTIASAGTSPDIYFKVDGLQGLGSLLGGGSSPVTSALNGVNGQWYVIDHSLFDQFAKGSNTKLQISSDDVSSVLKAVGDASKQYVFTSNTSKMVFVVKQNVGRETQDGRKLYHYKVGVNKENLKAYLGVLCGNLKAGKLKDLLSSASALDCASWQKSADNVDTSNTADAWVDLDTKLIHKVRFSEKSNANNYIDIGQDYTGGQIFPFTIGFQSKSGSITSTGNFKLSLDMTTNILSVSGTTQSGDSSGETGTFTLSVKPNNNPITVTKPATAKTFIQLLNDLGLGGRFTAASPNSSSLPGTTPTALSTAWHF